MTIIDFLIGLVTIAAVVVGYYFYAAAFWWVWAKIFRIPPDQLFDSITGYHPLSIMIPLTGPVLIPIFIWIIIMFISAAGRAIWGLI